MNSHSCSALKNPTARRSPAPTHSSGPGRNLDTLNADWRTNPPAHGHHHRRRGQKTAAARRTPNSDDNSTPTDYNDANPAIRPSTSTTYKQDNIDQGFQQHRCTLRRESRGLPSRPFWATYADPYTEATALTVEPARRAADRAHVQGRRLPPERQTVKFKTGKRGCRCSSA